MGRQQGRPDPDVKKVDQDQGSEDTQKVAMEVEEKDEVISAPKERVMDVVCFNCGDIGHFSTGCSEARCCFICRQENHVVDQCPKWQKSQLPAQFYGSACRGLGFYHIDVQPREGRFRHWKGLDNFGVLTIEQGDIEEKKIIDHLKNLFDDKWEWRLRQEDEYPYIIRFPPQKRVEDLVVGEATLFHLRGTRILASLEPWNGDVEPMGHLEDVWVQIKGIPPKWADWWTIKDVASSLGMLVEVDWSALFTSFFSNVRVRIKCKNPSRVPRERVYKIGGACYPISFLMEGVEQLGAAPNDEDGNGGGEVPKGDDDGPGGNEDNTKGDEDETKEDEGLEEDDLLDELPDNEKEKRGNGQSSKTNNQGCQFTGKKVALDATGNVSGGQSGKKQARRSLDFLTGWMMWAGNR